MKKILCLVLCLCIFISALCINVFAEGSLNEVTSLYDYNGDGIINLTDARTVLRVSAGLDQPRANLIYNLDGQDGAIPTINDVKIVISIVMGIDVEIANQEFLLALFTNELDNVKNTKPGFTKVATNKCDSMIVTTRNAPDPSLNVTNMPFDQYTKKTCDYLDDTLDQIDNPLGNIIGGMAGLTKEDIAEMRATIAAMRKEANDLYLPKTKETTIAKRRSHFATFPINNLPKSCYLKIDDIASITSKEVTDDEGNCYIERTVKMKNNTYIGDEFPTGVAKAAERREKIAYARVFNIPDFSETENGKETTVLNSVTFKDGEIVSKIDKLSGIPVYVRYSYTYVSDISTIPSIDPQTEKPNLEMDSVTTAKVIEEFTINPVTIN